MRSLALSAAILLAATGCATQNAGAPVAADQVAVHETVTSVTRPYKVIKRVWVDSWASNTFVPTYASRDDAVRAFQQHAASADVPATRPHAAAKAKPRSRRSCTCDMMEAS